MRVPADRRSSRRREVIAELHAWMVEYKLYTTLKHASSHTDVLKSIVVEVRLGDGAVGRAEIRANGAYATGEGPSEVIDALRSTDVVDVDRSDALEELRSQSTLAAMAIDVATCDAIARRRRVPL